MLAYDIFGIIAAVIGAYSLSSLFYSSIMGPLTYPFKYVRRYGESRAPWGRLKMFFSCLATNLLLLIGNLTVLSYVREAYVVSAGEIIIFCIVGGGLIFRIRLKRLPSREVAFKIVGSYCGAFTFAFLAKICVALFLHETSFPFGIEPMTFQDVVIVLACFVAVPLTIVTVGEYLATRR